MGRRVIQIEDSAKKTWDEVDAPTHVMEEQC